MEVSSWTVIYCFETSCHYRYKPYGLTLMYYCRVGLSSTLRYLAHILYLVHTVKSGYLAYAPDGSTTATNALDNDTHGPGVTELALGTGCHSK